MTLDCVSPLYSPSALICFRSRPPGSDAEAGRAFVCNDVGSRNVVVVVVVVVDVVDGAFKP